MAELFIIFRKYSHTSKSCLIWNKFMNLQKCSEWAAMIGTILGKHLSGNRSIVVEQMHKMFFRGLAHIGVSCRLPPNAVSTQKIQMSFSFKTFCAFLFFMVFPKDRLLAFILPIYKKYQFRILKVVHTILVEFFILKMFTNF